MVCKHISMRQLSLEHCSSYIPSISTPRAVSSKTCSSIWLPNLQLSAWVSPWHANYVNSDILCRADSCRVYSNLGASGSQQHSQVLNPSQSLQPQGSQVPQTFWLLVAIQVANRPALRLSELPGNFNRQALHLGFRQWRHTSKNRRVSVVF